MGESTLRGPASFRAHAVRLIPPLQIRGHSGTAMMIDFSCEDHDYDEDENEAGGD